MSNKNFKKTNVVFILSDDHGAWAMGCSGNKEIQTPNLDNLAKEGIRFENFFCSSPVCSPARASILTGKIPSQHGIHDWIKLGNLSKEDVPKNFKENNYTKDLTWEAQHFKEEKCAIEYLEGQVAYTDILAKNGYRCGLTGKWHLGNSLKPQKSFEYWSTIAFGGGNYMKPSIVEEGKVYTKFNAYITDYITDNAINYIEESQKYKEPFYLSVHYTAPHDPWSKDQHPEDIYNSYNNCPFESAPDDPIHPWSKFKYADNISKGERKKQRKEKLQGYYTAITAMDKNIGRIINKLEELGIRENTLIVFNSDNGMNLGHHGIWGKGNGTFPQNMFDTSVKVPMIISMPGHIPQGVVCKELLSHYDFMPTLLDYLGLDNPEADKLPGKSFAPILRGNKTSIREDVVVFDEYGPVRMIRTQEWKYIHRYPYGPHELYNLINDPDEKNNLINDPSLEEIIVFMKYKLQNWFLKYVNPSLDGSHEAVSGLGQVNFAGPKNKGNNAFV